MKIILFFSINYGWKQISMKNLKMRQNFLLANWGFQCSCRLCQYEKLNHPDEDKYENFAKLQQQSKKLLEVAKTAGQVRLAIIKKEVTCYKEMYKLAEQKNCSKVDTKFTVLKNIRILKNNMCGFNVCFECASSNFLLEKMNFHKIHICDLYGLHEQCECDPSNVLLEKMLSHKIHIYDLCGPHERCKCASSNLLPK